MRKTPKTHGNWESSADFVRYLRETLIPDLKLADMKETAKDFEDAVAWIQFLAKKRG